MKKIAFFILFAGLSAPSFASAILTPPISVGVDFAQPYVVTVDGNATNTRANMNMGLDFRYFTNNLINFGLRYALDIEKQAGTARGMYLFPGIQVQWLQGQSWMPYFRADIPVTLRGAPNTALNSSTRDVGIDIGTGIAWNLGDQIGIDHLIFRYDFVISYMFGIGDALNTFGIEFFKLGVEYRF